MLGLILGPLIILLGAKAFSETGIPLTREKNLTGTTAHIIGVVVILLGVAMFGLGIVGLLGILGMF